MMHLRTMLYTYWTPLVNSAIISTVSFRATDGEGLRESFTIFAFIQQWSHSTIFSNGEFPSRYNRKSIAVSRQMAEVIE